MQSFFFRRKEKRRKKREEDNVMKKLFVVCLVLLLVGLLEGCVPKKNHSPGRPQIDCPKETEVNATVQMSVVAVDRDGNRITYQVDFGDGHRSEWSAYHESGQKVIFTHRYEKSGTYGVKAIASDGRDSSGWSEERFIKCQYKVGPHRIMLNVGSDDDFGKVREIGVNTIHDWSIYWYRLAPELRDKIVRGPKPKIPLYMMPDNGRDYLDKADQVGLKVMYSLEPIIRDRIIEGLPWDRDEVDRVARMCDEHPAVSIIEVMDEPDMAHFDPKRLIPKEVQREICDFIRQRTNKPLMVIVSGGVSLGWDLVDFSLWDIIGIDHYCWDGTGQIWGEDPLVYFDRCCKLGADYLKEKYPDQLDKLIYIFQCCMVPAEGIDPYKPLPEGIMQQQFDAAQKYNLFTMGPALWGWNGGFYGPATSPKMYQEVKVMFDKIPDRKEN